MQRPGLVGLIVAATTILAACGSSGGMASATSQQAPMLTVAIGVDADTLDPMRQTTTSVSNMVTMVVESLAVVDQSGKVQPSLATAWQESADAMTWTFTLRTGVDFTDGTPFDATAVKANLDRIFDPKSVCPSCGALPKSVKSVDVVDPAHVQL